MDTLNSNMLSVFCFKRFLISLVAFAVFIFSAIFVVAYFKFFYPVCFSDEVLTYSKVNGLNPELVFAVINTESKFNSGVVSYKGAVGLMQIMPKTGEFVSSELIGEERVGELTNPKTNIMYGCAYLSYLFKKYEKLNCVLFAYNAGEGNLQKELQVNPDLNVNSISIKETKKYIKRVNKALKYYKIIMWI